MRHFLLSVRQIFQFQFWPHRRYCHFIPGQLLRKYDVILIFQDGGRGRSILLPVSYLLMYLTSDGQNLSTNQSSSTYTIFGWDITTAGLEKQPSTILEFYSRFRFRQFSRNLHFILHQPAEFRPNRSSQCGNITSYRFIKMAAADVEYYFRFRICCLQKVKVYGWDLTTSVFANKRPPYLNSTSGYDIDHFA